MTELMSHHEEGRETTVLPAKVAERVLMFKKLYERKKKLSAERVGEEGFMAVYNSQIEPIIRLSLGENLPESDEYSLSGVRVMLNKDGDNFKEYDFRGWSREEIELFRDEMEQFVLTVTEARDSGEYEAVNAYLDEVSSGVSDVLDEGEGH